jgi:alpha-galactosidase/6-phospho-beta-glucosidase family protein
MKATFVGGGSHRLLGILRAAMAVPGVFEGGEINLYDLNTDRSGVMGKMLMKTPEYQRCGCKITWGTSLDEALEGCDLVGVILMAGSLKSYRLGDGASLKHRYMSSDNVSLNGALLAMKGGPILLDVARRMERICPEALLLDFANPVPVMSGIVGNHTKINCLGVCQGFTNHQWDLSRLFGRDQQETDVEVDVAGINHLSFILKGRWKDGDLFEQLDRRLAEPGWAPPKLQDWVSEVSRRSITAGIQRLADLYRELGILIFSTEGDGMAHMYYDEELAKQLQQKIPTTVEVEQEIAQGKAARAQSDKTFESWLHQNLDENFWKTHWEKDLRFRREDEDIFTRILVSVGTEKEIKIVATRPNRGAVEGIKARNVLEYSMFIKGKSIRAAGSYVIPDVVGGMVSGLSAHQTMLGDAIANDDPKLLAQAMLAYPVRPYSEDLRELTRDLININSKEISPALGRAVEYI